MKRVIMICDRCGAEYKIWSCIQNQEQYGIAEIIHDNYEPALDIKKDLCEECYHSFEKWWKDGKEPIHKFPEVEGEMAEMLIDGVWIKGKIVNGYRFRDGIVTIEDDYGQRYWCGQNRTWEYRKYEERKKNNDG